MPMPLTQWLLLVVLALLWGSAFFFNALVLRELPPITMVLLRQALAAAMLLTVVRHLNLPLPQTLAGWLPFAAMSMLNNVIPFSLVAYGQREIGGGLASVINATTPLWSVLLAHVLTPGERITPQRLVGVLFGIAGVAVLFGPEAFSGRTAMVTGMAMVFVASLSYGFAGIWGRRLIGTPPISAACAQVVCSSLIMLPIEIWLDRPWQLAMPGLVTWGSLVALALFASVLGYIVFYRVLAVSGGTNVMLVTLLIPVVSIYLGTTLLGETFHLRYAAGALMIAMALLTIDGRVPAMLAGFGARRGI